MWVSQKVGLVTPWSRMICTDPKVTWEVAVSNERLAVWRCDNQPPLKRLSNAANMFVEP